MRTNHIKPIVLAIVFLAIVLVGKAQPSIGFGANGKIFGLPSSQFMSSTSNCNIWLKNCGSSNVTIDGNLRTSVDTSGTGIHFLQNDTIQSININAGDSVLFPFTIYYKYGQCRVGNNILVIWPSLTTGNGYIASCDTIASDSLTVLGFPGLGIDEAHDLLDGIFPNPVKDILTLKLTSGAAQPEYINILDMSGREWMVRSFTETIDLESLDNGIYFIRLLYSDKRSFTTRFVKME